MPLTPAQLDDRIDAVRHDLPGLLVPWNPPSDAGPRLTLSFKFASEQPADLGPSFSGWTEFSAQNKAAVLAALAQFEEVINVDFTETAAGDPDFNFGRVDMGPGLGGLGGFEYGYSHDGQSHVHNKHWDGFAVFNRSLDLSGTDINLVLHEIGHALGLKHPGDYDAGSGGSPAPYLPQAEDNNQYSVMSYNNHPGTGGTAPSLMLYDVAALQSLWGANYEKRSGNTTYFAPGKGRAYAAGDGVSPFVCIWDGGGRDTISASNQTSSVAIDLREGGFSTIGPLKDTVAIAYGAVIENATGGASGDTLSGNGSANVLGGRGGSDRLTGLGGEDLLSGGIGNDILNGGASNDVLTGGLGGDRQSGGGGADRFDFNAIGESAIRFAGRDVISGFGAGDRIDVSTIDALAGGADDEFAFIGGEAFTGTGQIRVLHYGGNTFADLNCATTIMRIQISGWIDLTSDDFVL